MIGKFLSFLLILGSMGVPPFLHASGWEFVYEQDGIRVEKTDVKNSNLILVRGQTVFNHSAKKVLSLMIDHNLRKEWVDRLVGINRLKEIDGVLDAISYYQVSLPWPVKDRDFVVRTKIWYDANTESIMSKSFSVPGIQPVSTDYVRAHSYDSVVALKEIAGGKTEITVEARIDPKGSIPHWLVNYLQTKWAHHTLKKLKYCLENMKIPITSAYEELKIPLGQSIEIQKSAKSN